jgi:phosphoadenosine phosphosulfate reductase
MNARARFQASTRRNLPVVEWDTQPVRINPLALWSRQQVLDYAWAHDVPCNSLYDRGYPSVGCWPCTRAVAGGKDVRGGRWAGLGKLEFGLWTQPADQVTQWEPQ